jgi:hypothetical protein
MFSAKCDLKAIPNEPDPKGTYRGYTYEDYAAYNPFLDCGLEITSRDQSCMKAHDYGQDGKECYWGAFTLPHTHVPNDRYVYICLIVERKEEHIRICLGCMHDLMKASNIKTGFWKIKQFPPETFLRVDGFQFYPERKEKEPESIKLDYKAGLDFIEKVPLLIDAPRLPWESQEEEIEKAKAKIEAEKQRLRDDKAQLIAKMAEFYLPQTTNITMDNSWDDDKGYWKRGERGTSY